MSNWQPDQAFLQQIIDAFRQSGGGVGTAMQMQAAIQKQLNERGLWAIYESIYDICDFQLLLRSDKPFNESTDNESSVAQFLDQSKQRPDFCNYLGFAMAQPAIEITLRHRAALFLKNTVASEDYVKNLHPEVIMYVKQSSFQTFSDSPREIQNAAGAVLNGMIRGNMNLAPEVFEYLLQLIGGQNAAACEAAFRTVSEICEDSAGMLIRTLPNLVDHIIPIFINQFENPNARIKSHAIASANHFVLAKAPALMQNIQAYVQGLYRRAMDDDADVIKNVCQGLVMTLEAAPSELKGQMQ
ncbi:Transportin-1, partial [Blyttiomyces sp. JEL0837]